MGKEEKGMFFEHDNKIKNIVDDANNKIDSILTNVHGIIKQRDDAINHIYELEEDNDRLVDEKRKLIGEVSKLIDEKNELLKEVHSLRDEINNRDKFGNYRNI